MTLQRRGMFRDEAGTLLMFACYENDPKLVEILLDQGASLEQADSKGRRALHYAACSKAAPEDKKRLVESICQRLKEGQRKRILNLVDKQGVNMFMTLYMDGKPDNGLVQLLLDWGIDCFQLTKRKLSVLHFAAENASIIEREQTLFPLIRILQQVKNNQGVRRAQQLLDQRTIEGDTMLMRMFMADSSPCSELIEFIMRNFCPKTNLANNLNKTVFHYAADNRKLAREKEARSEIMRNMLEKMCDSEGVCCSGFCARCGGVAKCLCCNVAGRCKRGTPQRKTLMRVGFGRAL